MKLRSVVLFAVGLSVAWKAAEAQNVALCLLGIIILGTGWVRLLALPGQGANPRPLPTATAQARSYELELVEQDEASELRAVVVEFLHRPLTPESVETLEDEVDRVIHRGAETFSRVLAGARPPAIDLHDYVGGSPVPPAKPADAAASVQPRRTPVSPVAQKIKYSLLEYRRVLIVNGSTDAMATAGYEKVQRADLAVVVKGSTIKVVKDRYGAVGTIDAGQLTDIRSMDDVEIVQA